VKKSSSGSKAARRTRAKSPRRRRVNSLDQGLLGPAALTATSDRILMSAANLFATLGFAHTSMPAIAKQSGITPGAIYRHFESKAELLMAVVRYALETLPTSVRVLEPAQLDASDLPEFAASYTTPGYKLIRQLSLEVHAAGTRADDAGALLTKVNAESARVISRSISAAQKNGTLDPKLDPDFAAIFFQAMVMGLAHLDTLQPGLIGNQSWHDFVLDRISAVLGFQRPARARPDSSEDPLSSDAAELDSD